MDFRNDNAIFTGTIQRVIDTVSDNGVPSWYETMQLNDFDVNFKIDTGSDVNVVSEGLLKKIIPNLVIDRQTNMLKRFGGSTIRVLGNYRLKCMYYKIERYIDVVVVDFDTVSIFGLQSSIDFGLADISHNARLQRIKRMNRFFLSRFNHSQNK